MGGTITEKEMEKYDYLRAEYYKENGKWPYTPRPLTNYEKTVINVCDLLLGVEHYSLYLKRITTYADFYLSDLHKIRRECADSANNGMIAALFIIKDELLPHKGKSKNFSKIEVEKILSSIYTIYSSIGDSNCKIDKVIRSLKDENDSVLGYLSGSEYYNKNKSDLAEKFLKCKYDELKNKDGLKNFYFDPGDIALLCTTVTKSIPQNIEDEIKNRETYLSNKKSRDYSDFMDMRKEMIALYQAGKFSKGDKLLREYAGEKYRLFNGVARHSFSTENLSDLGAKETAVGLWNMVEGTTTISMDLFIKTVIELGELRKKLENSTGEMSMVALRSHEKLYRGLPLYKLLQRIPGSGLPEKWKGKKVFEEGLCDEIIKYLTGKITVDPAPLSTSTNITVVKKFFNLDAVDKGSTGALLVIDASNYGKGQDMVPYSTEKYEKEVLLPMGVKLKIKSVTFKKEGSDGYFEVNCVPV